MFALFQTYLCHRCIICTYISIYIFADWAVSETIERVILFLTQFSSKQGFGSGWRRIWIRIQPCWKNGSGSNTPEKPDSDQTLPINRIRIEPSRKTGSGSVSFEKTPGPDPTLSKNRILNSALLTVDWKQDKCIHEVLISNGSSKHSVHV